MAEQTKSHFKVLQKFSSDYSTGLITKYESQRTGLQVLVVDAKSPKVYGFFVLATEIHDDSGAPHTLEHLIFMGSKGYAYKGVLGKLTTRAYAYTNAWTATDHTAYTLETAGWEGFAQILPVYLSHVLQPTLTESACYTEVHHVDGLGHDAGVVYSEMQGIQNTAEMIIDERIRHRVYPEELGFRYETGGLMEPLRELSTERIREFHRQLYQPKNLCVTIIGEVDHEHLLKTLDGFEDEMHKHFPGRETNWTRPWTEHVETPPLKNSTVEEVEFPEEDESMGEITVAFLGPSVNDLSLSTALDVLLIYLAGSSVSVLGNALVEKEQLASSVDFGTDDRPNKLIRFSLSGVATEQLAATEKRFFQLLKETASNKLDMSYLADCIQRQKRQIRSYVEDSPASNISDLVADFLFGARDGTTLRSLTSLKRYGDLSAWTEDDWKNFLNKWLADAAHISILGVPSAKMSEKIKADEKARIEERKAKLGPDGLRELEKKLEEAKKENEIDIPRSVLEKFTIPSADSIHFISTTTARSGLARTSDELRNPAQDIIDKDGADLPLFLHFEHVGTSFVYIALVISTEGIPVDKRPLLPLYMDNFFDTPIRRNGEVIPFEKVVTDLERDTISYSLRSGAQLDNGETLLLQLRVERNKYEQAIRWLKELFWDSVFDEERIKASVTKLLANVPEEKRDGDSMSSAVNTMIHYTPKSIHRARNTLVKASYLKQIRTLLKKEPQRVLSMLDDLRGAICQAGNFRILVVADLEKLERPVLAWKPFADRCEQNPKLQSLGSAAERLSQAGKEPGGTAYLVPMPTIDSSYAIHKAKGLDSPAHPRLPALLVALAYLNASEGPLWNAIRGPGLAYGTYLDKNLEAGHVNFTVYSSPAASKAFAAGRSVVEDLISGETAFETPALEGAVSEIILGFATEEANMTDAGRASFANQVILGVPKTYKAEMLKKVREVRVDEIKQVLKDVILPVFQPEKSNFVVTCAPVEVERVKKDFEDQSFKVEVKPLSFFHDDYGLKVDDGNDPSDDDEDEDEFDAEDEEQSKT